MTITRENLPELEGTKLEDAKRWFGQLRPHVSGVYVPGWHADDRLADLPGIAPDAAGEITRMVREIFDNAAHWPDQNVVYRLVSDQKVAAETIWPGFVADVETEASRLGYVSIPDRELPNFVIEEYGGEFYLLEFDTIGKISECELFTMSRLEGVSYNRSGEGGYVLVDDARIVDGSTRTFDEIGEHSHIIAEIHHATAPRSHHP
ncbi:hypothetical protein GOB57_09895 [Sinorhizobium meliloti]|nr:hypothetical protein [Sinorhizobium meliloti]